MDNNVIKITLKDGDYWVKKIDTTHLAISNSEDGVDLAIPGHIAQYRDEPYYSDLRAWLKGGKSPDGMVYEGTYLKEQTELERLISKKEKLRKRTVDMAKDYESKYGNIDISQPMSTEEKEYRKKIDANWSEIQQLVRQINKLKKSTTSESLNEVDMPGEWVLYVDYGGKGKKLIKTLKSGRAAKMALNKSYSLLNNDDVKSIGTMTKKEWDATESKYAIKEMNEVKKFYTSKQIMKFAKKAGDIVKDAKYDIEDLAVSYGDKVPHEKLQQLLNAYDLEMGDLRESVVSPSSEDAHTLNILAGREIGTGPASEFLSNHNIDLRLLKKEKAQGVINQYTIRDVVTGKAGASVVKNFIDLYSKVDESMNESVWTPAQQKQVRDLDNDFSNLLMKKGIEPYSKAASDLWKNSGFQKNFKQIFNKSIDEVSPRGNDVGESTAGFSVGSTVLLQPKAGYWDVTQYPYGGDFKRVPADGEVIGTVVSGPVKTPSQEVRLDIDLNGKKRTIVIKKEFLSLKENTVNESDNTSEPQIITQLRDVMKSGYKSLKDPKTGKKMKVDSFSASAIVKVYDALKDDNIKEKFVNSGLLGMQNLAFKFVK